MSRTHTSMYVRTRTHDSVNGNNSVYVCVRASTIAHLRAGVHAVSYFMSVFHLFVIRVNLLAAFAWTMYSMFNLLFCC